MLEQREEEAKVEIVVREGELGETAAGSEARLLHLPQGGGELRRLDLKHGQAWPIGRANGAPALGPEQAGAPGQVVFLPAAQKIHEKSGGPRNRSQSVCT